MSRQLWLLRHGATEWALDGRHTGITDLPLLPEGEAEARALAEVLGQQHFAAVFSSPLQRARRTCELAGLGEQMQINEDIVEWNYGDYEGITTSTIRETVPKWTVWSHGCPNGEDAQQVEVRCVRAINTALAVLEAGDVALFAHGHILRALAGTWLGLGACGGQLLPLGTATVSILGWERDIRAIQRWNAPAKRVA
ncbi:phosphoglycerate mutase [Synechococcus sp. KORDI-52]|uniref:histidine phosphatase family protein n=1 Tax=Synechococcus sp. KORDI-52 TaxID=585425 RepID=UPI0004E09C49|nr:histidine phosphatase family protein [Synechococcus sp. KORDI-52]AII48825.1 phosphoglycerate mutase [Synechococcus sp. KORDI-52]